MSIIQYLRNSPATAALCVILLAALGLRLWGIWFGLPYLLHNDEGFEVIRALQLGSGQFDFDRISKGGYFYVLFVEYGVLFVVMMMLGIASTPTEFAQIFVSDPTAFYLVGRATTAILATATIYVVYVIGRQVFSQRAGLLAAALLGANVLHASLSHYITVDVPMVFLAMLALLFALRIVVTGYERHYWLAALCAAGATATKLPAVVLLLPLTISHVYFVSSQGFRIKSVILDKRLWQAAAIFVVAYLALAPGIVVNYDVFFTEIFGKFSGGDNASGTVVTDTVSGRNLVSYYVGKIYESMGLPVFVLVIAGIVLGTVRHRPADVILLSYSVVTFIAIAVTSDSHHFFPRYALPVLPPVLLLAARLGDSVFNRIWGHGRTAIEIVIVILVLALPVSTIAQNNYRLTQPDTRVLAKEWMDSHVPPNSRVFIEGARTRPYNATVPLQNSAENLKESIGRYEQDEPGKARYFRLALESLAGATFDLELVSFTNLRELDYYRDKGVQYFVLRPGVRAEIRPQEGWPEFIAEVRADPEIHLIKRFEPDKLTTPGPVIEIYRVR